MEILSYIRFRCCLFDVCFIYLFYFMFVVYFMYKYVFYLFKVVDCILPPLTSLAFSKNGKETSGSCALHA